MAAPTLFAAGVLFAAAAGTNITPVIPANTQVDDIAVAEYMCNAASTFTTPTGWTVRGTAVNSANQSTAWFWRRLVGGDANPSSTTSATGSTSVGLYGRVYVFRGCITTGDPFESVGNAGAPANTSTPQTSQVVTTGVNRLVCSLVLVDDDNVWNSGMPPAGWTNLGGRLISTTGGDCMSDAIFRTEVSATTVAVATVGTMSAADFWRTLSFALIPAPTVPVVGAGTGLIEFTGTASGTRVPSTAAKSSRAPIACVLAVETSANWNVHPYYKVPVTISNWGNATDLATIDAALAANHPNRTRVVLVAEDSDTSLGRCAAVMNWAFRHYDEVQSVHLRTPIIDLVERHDRVSGDAASIETAYGGAESHLNLNAVLPGRAWAADAVPLRLMGTVDIRIGLRNRNWLAQRSLVARYRTTDSQRSYWFRTTATGMLEWLWTTAGTSAIVVASTNHTALNTLVGDEPIALRVVFKPIDGGNHSVRFETSTYVPGTWTQLGDLRSFASNTSIHPGTANLEIGSINDGVLNLLDADVGWVEVRDGENGTVVADPDFTVQSPGTTSFSDGTNTWTVVSPGQIRAGFLGQMSEWNPAYHHRRFMAAQLFSDKLHIWRDPSDTVTPAATTDAIAAEMRATVHPTLGTPDEIVPDTQDWVQQVAWQQMRKIHDYSRTAAVNTGFRAGDGGKTLKIPDGRWLTFIADTVIGSNPDPDDTQGTGGNIVRNSILIHDGNGNVTGQMYSGAPGTPALVPNQTEYPSSFYWLIGACMESGLVNVLTHVRTEDGGFGVFVDMNIVRINPNTLVVDSVVSFGEPEVAGVENLVPDSQTGFIYIVMYGPNSLGRVPIGQLSDLAAWRFWDGTTWNTDRNQRAALLEDVDGVTFPLKNNTLNDSFDIRRYGTTWVAVVRGWFEPYVGVYYSLTGLPQGPYRKYMYVPTPECGGTRYGNTVYAYTPFWHPERDPAPNQLMMSYNAIVLGPTTPSVDQDFYFACPHFVVCPFYREI